MSEATGAATPLPSSARIVIAGAGAIGQYVGVRLAAGGRRVAFLGRKALAQAARASGMVATDRDGGEVRLAARDVEVSEDPAVLAGAEVILVTTKSRDTEAMAKTIAAHAPGTAIVVSLQNGLRNPERLRAALPGRDVREGMVPFNVTLRQQGVVHRATAGDPRVADGSATGGRPGLAELMTVPGLATLGVADMTGVLWTKLLMNQNNALNALSGLPLAEQLADIRWRRILAACVEEGLAEAKAATVKLSRFEGVSPKTLPRLLRLPTPLFTLLAGSKVRADAEARSSMQDDLVRKKPTEIDDLQGEISRRAHARGAAAPMCRAIATLIREAEVAAEGPPRLTPERVEEMARSGRG
jgi:2-dehydropantoate 2-reductase